MKIVYCKEDTYPQKKYSYMEVGTINFTHPTQITVLRKDGLVQKLRTRDIIQIVEEPDEKYRI